MSPSTETLSDTYRAWGPLTSKSPISETLGIAINAVRSGTSDAAGLPLDVALHPDDAATVTAPDGVTILTDVPGLVVPQGHAFVRVGGGA